jgi:hypothetical protein
MQAEPGRLSASMRDVFSLGDIHRRTSVRGQVGGRKRAHCDLSGSLDLLVKGNGSEYMGWEHFINTPFRMS